MISKYHFMALHFLAKPWQDYCSAKGWKQQIGPAFVVTTNRNASCCLKMAISGVPYIHILDFTGGIYFKIFDIIPLHCPVFLSIAPHPLSVLVNCLIPKFRLSEKVFRISWYSPVIKFVTWISTNVYLLVLDKCWQLFSYLKTIWYNVWNVFRLS